MNTYLGLCGSEDLNLIVEYLLSNDDVEPRYKESLKNDLMPEYVTYDENEYYFSFHFRFKTQSTVLNVDFDKKGYYDWVKPIFRRRKLEKIMDNRCHFRLNLLKRI